MVIFHSYVSLPEGMLGNMMNDWVMNPWNDQKLAGESTQLMDEWSLEEHSPRIYPYQGNPRDTTTTPRKGGINDFPLILMIVGKYPKLGWDILYSFVWIHSISSW